MYVRILTLVALDLAKGIKAVIKKARLGRAVNNDCG
jgi:hypothetical protein